MPINGTCKCGTDRVTNAIDGIKWAVEGCEDCGEKVTFDVNKTERVRPGRGR
jgi:hypothetical protein